MVVRVIDAPNAVLQPGGRTAWNSVRKFWENAKPLFVNSGRLGDFIPPLCSTNHGADRGNKNVMKAMTEIDIFPGILDFFEDFEQ